jgi:hypothetical protein
MTESSTLIVEPTFLQKMLWQASGQSSDKAEKLQGIEKGLVQLIDDKLGVSSRSHIPKFIELFQAAKTVSLICIN